MSDVDETIQKIKELIARDKFHPGDVLSIEVTNDYTLDEEEQVYLAAVEALHQRGYAFVKVKMSRPIKA